MLSLFGLLKFVYEEMTVCSPSSLQPIRMRVLIQYSNIMCKEENTLIRNLHGVSLYE